MKIFSRFFPSSKPTPKELVAVEDNYAPKDNVFRVEWNLGKRCNYDCSYCSPSIHDKKSDHISLDIVEKTVKKMTAHAKSMNKAIRISLTGGEPYIHPNFEGILKIIKDNGVKRIAITTNASLPAQTYIDSFQYIDYLILSIHFEFANVDKLKEKIIKIHSNLKGNQKIHLHIMAIPSKVKEATDLAKMMDHLNISYALRRVRPQYTKEGTFLTPFNSGQLGDHKADFELIKKDNLTYYSSQELKLLGVTK
jgi:organic radical activating enzyme